MTRHKKTRSLADKVKIRTGRRKDYKKWRHENPDEAGPSRRFVSKKQQQRKQQAQKRLERQQNAPTIEIHPSAPKDAPDSGDEH
ncbi:hypothetical protein [Vreelandella subglaciescola]|jgi:hypothetical protein|uniref:Uncharacterized protein n=1 Tax=Vreelandella subglaciescola TaxID=29571 RepID=A0A1M7EYZ7_9GAMM|nr:hypothetical protein [Halomonas subglaciescola]SHL96943.1 hypothetical protein SAMN05878437_0544 [Halomonas subglaciescola]